MTHVNVFPPKLQLQITDFLNIFKGILTNPQAAFTCHRSAERQSGAVVN